MKLSCKYMKIYIESSLILQKCEYIHHNLPTLRFQMLKMTDFHFFEKFSEGSNLLKCLNDANGWVPQHCTLADDGISPAKTSTAL